MFCKSGRVFLLGSLFLSAIFISGCGEATGPQLSLVRGTVVFKGAGLTGGTVKIFDAGNTLVGQASINSSGEFIATDLPRGELKVTVETVGGAPAMNKMQTKPPPGTPVLPSGDAGASVTIPKKYLSPETTDLRLIVTAAEQKCELKLE